MRDAYIYIYIVKFNHLQSSHRRARRRSRGPLQFDTRRDHSPVKYSRRALQAIVRAAMQASFPLTSVTHQLRQRPKREAVQRGSLHLALPPSTRAARRVRRRGVRQRRSLLRWSQPQQLARCTIAQQRRGTARASPPRRVSAPRARLSATCRPLHLASHPPRPQRWPHA